MGMESTVSDTTAIVPSHVIKKPNLCTGLPWDNFDINIETLSGADSIHHTYGICYQNIADNLINDYDDIHMTVNSSASSLSKTSTKKSVKEFCKVNDENVTQEILEPVTKKPKMSSFNFNVTDIYPTQDYTTARYLDLLWTMIFNLSSIEIPLWNGWNTLTADSNIVKQKVCSMKHIPLPPSRLDVVRETLKRTQAVAKECCQEYAIVTYDLAIAKVAKQIKSDETPRFDNVFIMFGAFHIMLNIYSCVGKIIEGSGGPYALSEAKIVAPGSINKFLKGKMFNRCKRGNTILSTAIHGLHIKRFIEDVAINKDTLCELNDIASHNKIDQETLSDSIKTQLTQYDFYLNDTLSGARGKTAQFWIQYAHIIDIVNLLQRAIKTNDTQLFAYALYEICPIFFMVNHHNYARWMTHYSLELANLHPNIDKILREGAFSVNRSGKSFAHVPVDMALEQTINAEAKNRLKGIMQFADVSSSVNRWMVISSMKTELVNTLLEIAGITEASTVHKETKTPRKKRDNKDVKEIKNIICETMNPFDEAINKESLFNIKTGRVASKESESYLLNLFSTGAQQRDNFIQECSKKPDSFEKAIKKQKIVNFAYDNLAKKNKSKVISDIVSAKETRDLFGRLLYLAVKHKVSYDKLFLHPILPEPPCFCHPDGTIYQSNKSVMQQLLIKSINSSPPTKFETAIADGMFILKSTISQRCPTYASFARSLLLRVINLAIHRIDLCFDVHESPCIKDSKRKDRGDEITERNFSFGPRQKFPTDITNLLKISEFKKELLRFLLTEYEDPVYSHIIGSKTFYCSVDNTCRRYYVSNGKYVVEDVHELYGSHLEADTRLAFHASHADSSSSENILVRGNDTDIFVILSYNANKFQCNIWLDSGLDDNNSRKIIDIKKVHEAIENVEALPGIYAFTGIDYLPSFYRKGKVKPYQLMQKSERFSDAFSSLGETELTEEVVDIIEEFVCHMYGFRSQTDIHQVLIMKFEDKCKPKSVKSPLSSIKSIDPKTFPPCKKVLIEQIKRSWYISKSYKSATSAYPTDDLAEIDYGWKLSEDKNFLDIKWFEGDQLPIEVENLEEVDNSDDESIDEESTDDEESDNENSDDE